MMEVFVEHKVTRQEEAAAGFTHDYGKPVPTVVALGPCI